MTTPPPRAASPARSPRPRRAAVLLLAALTLPASACGSARATSAVAASTAEPGAGTWKLWVLPSPSAMLVAPPPAPSSPQAHQEAVELTTLAQHRTAADRAAVHRFADYPPTRPWTQLNEELVSQQVKDPPLASRGYALVAVAMNDATVSAWYWKYQYRRPAPRGTAMLPIRPDPSYPSDDAAIAGAASRVLAYLFPQRSPASWDQIADDAAQSLVAGGLNYRSDVVAGLTLGRAVAAAVIARARTDGSNRVWDGSRPTGAAYWQPPPGVPAEAAPPVEPLAGTWRTWVIDGPNAVPPPPPPPAYGSAAYLADVYTVVDTARHLTAEQRAIAKKWAAGGGTSLPPGVWNDIALAELVQHPIPVPRAVQLVALLNVAEADAGVAAWRTKYKYWTARPVNVIRALGLDPSFAPVLSTPLFPSYLSGHSTYSAAAAQVLGAVFPSDAARLQAMAEEAGISRIYAGIHFPADNRAGLALGAAIGRLVVRTAPPASR